jgi:hypothetical protein
VEEDHRIGQGHVQILFHSMVVLTVLVSLETKIQNTNILEEEQLEIATNQERKIILRQTK